MERQASSGRQTYLNYYGRSNMRSRITKEAITILRNEVNIAGTWPNRDKVELTPEQAMLISDEIWRLDGIVKEGNEFGAA